MFSLLGPDTFAIARNRWSLQRLTASVEAQALPMRSSLGMTHRAKILHTFIRKMVRDCQQWSLHFQKVFFVSPIGYPTRNFLGSTNDFLHE